MKQGYWLLAGVVGLIVLWYVVPQPSPVPTTGGNATTTTPLGSTQNPAGSGEDLTLSGVRETIVGIWESTTAPATFAFAANGSFSMQVGTEPKEAGTWSLYTSENVPADLTHLIFEPDHVFVRLTVKGSHADYLVWKADAENFAMGPIGQGGSITFKRKH